MVQSAKTITKRMMTLVHDLLVGLSRRFSSFSFFRKSANGCSATFSPPEDVLFNHWATVGGFKVVCSATPHFFTLRGLKCDGLQ